MEYIALEKNYRFENNDEMLLLEKILEKMQRNQLIHQ